MGPGTRAPSASRLPTMLFIAWRNIWRYPVRSLLTISALAGSLVMVILHTALMEGMTRQMVQYATGLGTGHIQVHRQEFIDNRDLYATLPWSYLEEMEAAHPGLRLAPRLYAAGLASAGETSTGALIKAVDPRREPGVTQVLAHTQGGEADLGTVAGDPGMPPRHRVLVGARLAKNMGIGPGDELVLVTQAADGSIGNALFEVGAVLRSVEPGFDRLGVLMSTDAYRDLMYLEDGFHELAVRAGDGDRLEDARESLARGLADLQGRQPLDELGGAPVVRDWRQLSPVVADMLQFSRSMLVFFGLIVVGLASLGVLNTMLMAVHERTHEFGILLAIGMGRGWLMAVVLLESLLLSLVSVLVGAALGAWGGRHLEVHGIDFSGAMPDGYDWAGIVFEPVMRGWMRPGDVLAACALVVVVAVLASLIPSWRVVRLRPVEALQ